MKLQDLVFNNDYLRLLDVGAAVLQWREYWILSVILSSRVYHSWEAGVVPWYEV